METNLARCHGMTLDSGEESGDKRNKVARGKRVGRGSTRDLPSERRSRERESDAQSRLANLELKPRCSSGEVWMLRSGLAWAKTSCCLVQIERMQPRCSFGVGDNFLTRMPWLLTGILTVRDPDPKMLYTCSNCCAAWTTSSPWSRRYYVYNAALHSRFDVGPAVWFIQRSRSPSRTSRKRSGCQGGKWPLLCPVHACFTLHHPRPIRKP
ncbi:hypothetical protein QBC35DRAFT_227549 [Podospora australis]|uniref:Uncharacterized protein n=1 Tax=Podospora australis TaxID=1536484 RepID=A0AAN7AP71_9PEZI|nr:hypothetical protein QBC35DRAFT_227549 [Podospora australis]